MIRQSQSDALIDFIDRKIDDIQDEIRYEEACWDEAPARNKSDWLEMKWSDAVADLEWKLHRYEQLREDAEMLQIQDEIEEPEFPAKHLYLPVERRAARSIV